jgi:hypothetical protein
MVLPRMYASVMRQKRSPSCKYDSKNGLQLILGLVASQHAVQYLNESHKLHKGRSSLPARPPSNCPSWCTPEPQCVYMCSSSGKRSLQGHGVLQAQPRIYPATRTHSITVMALDCA